MCESYQDVVKEVVDERAKAWVGEDVGYFWELDNECYPEIEVFFRSSENYLPFYENKLRLFLLSKGIGSDKAEVRGELHAKDESIHRLFITMDFTKIKEEEFVFMKECLRTYGRRYEDIC